MYGAKTAVDICVTSALAAVLAFPGTSVSYWLDKAGTALVSLYMILCGIKTIREKDSLKREEAYFLGHFYSKK